MTPEVNEVSDDNILVLKAKFKAVPSTIFGLMILIFNKDREFETYNVVVSTYSEIYKTEMNMEWDKYEEIIVDMKWKGQFNNNLTSSLMDNLNTLSGELGNMNLLYNHIYNYNYKELEIIVFDLINRIIHDKNLILETVIQEVTPTDYINVKKKRSKPKEEEKPGKTDSGTEQSSGSVILPIDLILSPVKGKPIYNLKIGDILMVRIKATSDRANYLIDDLDLKNEKEIKPVPAEVIDIKAGTQRNDPIEILTKIIPGYFGKSYENEHQVKLRMFDPAVDEEINLKNIKPLVEEKKGEKKEKIPGESIMNKGTLVMLILLLLILLLFALLIMIGW